MNTLLKLTVGSISLAGRLIAAVAETAFEDEYSVEYWLERGYYVVYRENIESYEYRGSEYEERTREFVSAHETYDEAYEAKGWFQEIARP